MPTTINAIDVPLAMIPAEFIGHARRQLPPLQPGAAPAAGIVTIGTPWHLGEVRIWFEVYTPPASQRRRGVPCFWPPARAERASEERASDGSTLAPSADRGTSQRTPK